MIDETTQEEMITERREETPIRIVEESNLQRNTDIGDTMTDDQEILKTLKSRQCRSHIPRCNLSKNPTFG